MLWADNHHYIPQWGDVLLGLLVIIICPVAIIVQVKRWHDRNKSAWWVLINLIPYIGFFWTFIECGFIKGTKGENRYGEDPLIPQKKDLDV